MKQTSSFSSFSRHWGSLAMMKSRRQSIASICWQLSMNRISRLRTSMAMLVRLQCLSISPQVNSFFPALDFTVTQLQRIQSMQKGMLRVWMSPMKEYLLTWLKTRVSVYEMKSVTICRMLKKESRLSRCLLISKPSLWSRSYFETVAKPMNYTGLEYILFLLIFSINLVQRLFTLILLIIYFSSQLAFFLLTIKPLATVSFILTQGSDALLIKTVPLWLLTSDFSLIQDIIFLYSVSVIEIVFEPEIDLSDFFIFGKDFISMLLKYQLVQRDNLGQKISASFKTGLLRNLLVMFEFYILFKLQSQ